MFFEFKYISCSYLSASWSSTCGVASTFKYISCSYLSKYAGIDVDAEFEFKYISCSYLSCFHILCITLIHIIQIHLMFLFIGLHLISTKYGIIDSNTSHVLIYQYNHRNEHCRAKFKYISCSYLSGTLCTL